MSAGSVNTLRTDLPSINMGAYTNTDTNTNTSTYTNTNTNTNTDTNTNNTDTDTNINPNEGPLPAWIGRRTCHKPYNMSLLPVGYAAHQVQNPAVTCGSKDTHANAITKNSVINMCVSASLPGYPWTCMLSCPLSCMHTCHHTKSETRE